MKLKTRSIYPLLIILALASLLITACNAAEPEIDIDAQRTGFAQTADAQATMTAQAQPTATNTPQPTATSAATATPEVTETSDDTETETAQGTETTEVAGTQTVQATPTTGMSGGTDSAAWIAQEPADNTEYAPGEGFTVTWTLENTGSSTWSTSYYIQFAYGEAMGAEEEKVYLPYPVPPNTNVQISVDLVAPESTGEKQSNWRFFNTSETSFYEFYVIINVVEE